MRVVEPVEWDIKIRKCVKDDREIYKIDYEEFIKKPNDVSFESFEKTIDYMDRMLKKLEYLEYDLVKTTDNDGKLIAVKVHVVLEGELEDVADMMLSEFLPFSRFGRMRIGDVIIGSIYRMFEIFGKE